MRLPTFDLRLVRSFAVLGEELHFGRAAERLSIAQPVLSRQIARLESQLGAPLLTRANRRLRLTPAGTRFLAASREIVACADALQDGVGAAGAELVLHLGNAKSALVRDAVRDFCALHPTLETRISDSTLSGATAAVRDRRADVGFDLRQGISDGLGWLTLDTPLIGVACRSDHPLAGSGGAAWDDLDGETLFLAAPGVADGYNALLRSILSERMIAVTERVMPVSKGEYLAPYIADGQGVLVSTPYLFQSLPAGIDWVPLSPSIHAELGAVWRTTDRSPTTRQFLRYLAGLSAITGHRDLAPHDELLPS